MNMKQRKIIEAADLIHRPSAARSDFTPDELAALKTFGFDTGKYAKGEPQTLVMMANKARTKPPEAAIVAAMADRLPDNIYLLRFTLPDDQV